VRHVHLHSLPVEGVSHNPEIRKRVMLRSGAVPHLTNFSQSRFGPGQRAVAHAHADMFEVFFVEDGEGTILIDGAEHPLVPGVCAVVEPGEVHELRNHGPGELVLTYFGIAAPPHGGGTAGAAPAER
jgi:quercetin dioxygenase-like cupin family protein